MLQLFHSYIVCIFSTSSTPLLNRPLFSEEILLIVDHLLHRNPLQIKLKSDLSIVMIGFQPKILLREIEVKHWPVDMTLEALLKPKISEF